MARKEKISKTQTEVLKKGRTKVHDSDITRGKKVTEQEYQQEWQELPETFVGVLSFTKRGGVVFVDHKALDEDIIIRAPFLNGANEGQKVVVKLTKYPTKWRQPEGEIIDILGEAGENDTEMHAILAEFGLPYSYPSAIETEANEIDSGINAAEILRRRDIRDVLTFTIDPADAKDFDDALSYRPLENGHTEVGVHIADVTHYVKPETSIDEEAYRRGTSVYLVDRTIPMLPEHLCNEICSLRPNEEKLCMSVVFELDENAKVIKSKICRTVICSNARLTYEGAQEIIDQNASTTGGGNSIDEAILKLNDLAQRLRKERFAHGAINFDREEVRFDIDENGKPTRIYFKTQKEANMLIEEFMLLANRTIAQAIAKPAGLHPQPKTFVYRVHDVPDPDKIEQFSKFIKRFGYNLKASSNKESVSKGINHLMRLVQGKSEQDLVQTLAIRAMAKAVYTTHNIGHYGLAFPYYTHFTSPIRRYPDMMVHRLVERYIFNGKSSVGEDEYEQYCDHCSNREQLAANAERASAKYKQIEFMQDHMGELFEAVITGITDWGIYAEITENKCEGLVPIRDIKPVDYYVYDEAQLSLRGEYNGKVYHLGDHIEVKVAKTDLQRRLLDFSMEEYLHM